LSVILCFQTKREASSMKRVPLPIQRMDEIDSAY
jgi:hypothetical protein